MQEIIVDEEFKSLLQVLDNETRALLEESILAYGCQNPLVLWNSILIDGHNRYEIIKAHSLPYRTISMEFKTREDVVIWIISTQIARRNLNSLQLSHFRGLHYNTDKQIQGTYERVSPEIKNAQNGHFQNSTASRLAEQYNVSRNTIRRDAQVSEAIMSIGEVSPEAKSTILSGKASISRSRLQELATAPESEILEAVGMILDGTHKRRQERKPERLHEKESGHGSTVESYEQLSLENFIIKITDDFNSGIRKLSPGEDMAKSKVVLKSFIEMLEELYSRI